MGFLKLETAFNSKVKLEVWPTTGWLFLLMYAVPVWGLFSSLMIQISFAWIFSSLGTNSHPRFWFSLFPCLQVFLLHLLMPFCSMTKYYFFKIHSNVLKHKKSARWKIILVTPSPSLTCAWLNETVDHHVFGVFILVSKAEGASTFVLYVCAKLRNVSSIATPRFVAIQSGK